MKRQKKDTESLVYAYGVVPDSFINDPHVQEEVRRMRAMWDSLVDIEHGFQDQLHNILLKESKEYADACQELEQIKESLGAAISNRNQARAKARSKKIDPSYQKEVKRLARKRDELQTNLNRLVGRWKKDNKERYGELEQQRERACIEVRQTSGLYWANYNQILSNFEAARITCMKKGRRVRHQDWSRKDGCLTVQIQRTASGLGAAPLEIMDGGINQIQIGYIPPEVYNRPRVARTRACKTEAKIRVDATGHMAHFQVWFHRALPQNGRVKKAQLAWKREGEKIKGNLCLTISRPKQQIPQFSSLAAGVDLGWRLLDDGSLLVATVKDNLGRIYRYNLSLEWMRGKDQERRLGKYISQEILKVAEYLHRADRINSLLLEPVQNWRPGWGAGWVNSDQLQETVRSLGWNVPEPVLHWYHRHRHLSVWRDNLRAKLNRRRREIYRLLARELAQEYGVIGLEQMDLSKMARTKKRPDYEDNELHRQAREQRTRACIHSLRSEIEHQAKKHGVEIVKVKAPYTTMRCRDCGRITRQDRREKRWWICECCSSIWDQDRNAAENILAAAWANANLKLSKIVGDENSGSYEPIEVVQKGVRDKRQVTA